MKSYPHNPEAEAAVLGSVLLQPARMAELVDLVQPADFFIPQHQVVFEAMQLLFAQERPIDAVTLEAKLHELGQLKLAGGIEAIARLADRYIHAKHPLYHAQTVRRLAELREMAITCEALAEEAHGAMDEPLAFMDEAERRVLAVGLRSRRSGWVGANALVHGTFQRITARSRSGRNLSGTETAFYQLDRMLGGLQAGDLIIVAARPSMGKTAFVLNLAANVCVARDEDVDLFSPREPRNASGAALQPTLFFSLEMSAEQLSDRLLCSEARVDAARLRENTFLDDDWQRLVTAGKRVAKSPLYVDDQAAPTILEIRARARRFRSDRSIFPSESEGQVGLIIVDYLQLARGSKRRYDSREQEISEISSGLKAMAKELKMPVLALSQLNRAVDSRADHRPQLSDLRESGAIEQDADVILFIYREERYCQDEARRREIENTAEIIVGKQRNGPVGTVPLHFFKKYTRFENPAPE